MWCKIIVEEADVVYTGSKHCYGDSSPDYFYGFICPECGSVTDVDDIPSRIISKIPRVVSGEIRSKIY